MAKGSKTRNRARSANALTRRRGVLAEKQLIDLSALAREMGFSEPVFITQAAYDECHSPRLGNPGGGDPDGLAPVLRMLQLATRSAREFGKPTIHQIAGGTWLDFETWVLDVLGRVRTVRLRSIRSRGQVPRIALRLADENQRP